MGVVDENESIPQICRANPKTPIWRARISPVASNAALKGVTTSRPGRRGTGGFLMQPRPPRTENRFRERELARAVRAAKAAGGERVEVDPESGKITVIIAKGAPGAETQAAGAKAWDDATEVLKSKEASKSAPTRR